MFKNQAHFLQTIQENTGIIESLCRVYFPVKEDQQDCRQEIILQLWKSRKKFRHECKAATFIYRVSLNTILKKVRKESKFPEHYSLESIPLPATHRFGADDHIQQLEIMLKWLKPMDRALLILQLEGYSNQEIAGILPMSLTNISTRLNRIRNYLKSRYHDQSYIQ